MKQPIFNRYERKYLINETTMQICIDYFKNYLSFDPYSLGGKHYTIYNLYFDTTDFSIIRSSIQKPRYKEKLRLRTYDNPVEKHSTVYLEIKKKYLRRVNKRRVTLSYEDALNYLDNKVFPTFDNYHDQQMMKEIDYFIHVHQAKPGAYIKYDRIALISASDDIRITFDFNIQYRTTSLNLDDQSGQSILPHKDSVIMEIKSDQNFPFWIVDKLSELKIYSQSFSKYGKAYEYYIGGITDDDTLNGH
ncbi:MAG: polyphosphate polymerase domain-containing protein [Acholeplasmataceae bacterium]|nr:polyphosphate polymerase domain-containing protein [Acholeplasmataceae bacterium]